MAESNPKKVSIGSIDDEHIVYNSDEENNDLLSEVVESISSSSLDSDGEDNCSSEFGSNTSLQMDQAATDDDYPIYISKDGTIWKDYSSISNQNNPDSLYTQLEPHMSSNCESCESAQGIYNCTMSCTCII